jgi:hypothetical protein
LLGGGIPLGFAVYFITQGASVWMPSLEEFKDAFYVVKVVPGGIIGQRPMWGDSPEEAYQMYLRSQQQRQQSAFITAAALGVFGAASAIGGVIVLRRSLRKAKAAKGQDLQKSAMIR